MPTAEAGGAAKRVKKNEERENRDLFAERDPDHDFGQGSAKVKDTLLPPPSFGFTTGSRNESSVLFRVDQLSDVGGRIKTPDPIFAPTNQMVAKASEPPRFGGDEEGVIDLKALASVPPPGAKRSIIPVAPLFSEPPPMLVDANGFSSGSQPVINKPISKGKLFGAIAAAAVFLVVAGFGISLAFKGEEPVHHAAAIAPPPPPSPTVTASAPPVDPAPASSTASNEDTGTKGKKAGKKGGKKTSGSSQASTEPKKPPKAADPCGCKGDFNCILACTAKNGK